MKQSIKELKTFFVLWSTQSLSPAGSAMTSFALALWLYGETGSALQTALLSVCSYAPYVVMSVFAGGPQRPVGQEKGHACLRQPGGALHYSGAGFAERGLACPLAHVPAKRPERPDEHGAAGLPATWP